MTNRELFHATMARQNGPDLLHIEQGFAQEVFSLWREQGLPDDVLPPATDVTHRGDLYEAFNIAKLGCCRWNQINQFHVPTPVDTVLEEYGDRIIFRGQFGHVYEKYVDDGVVRHRVLQHCIRDRDDYMAARNQLAGHLAERVDLGEMRRMGPVARSQQNHPVGVWVHGPFAFLRELMGAEAAMMAPYIDADLTRVMLDDHLEVCRAAASAAFEHLRPDFSYVWEDNCCKNGPMVAPDVFREFHLPWYKAWRGFLDEMGVRWMVVDSDGDPTALVPLWIEGGVDAMFPWEVNAVDILKIAEAYPGLVLLGGFWKHCFERDGLAAVDAEFLRVVEPLRRRGGWFPSLDHWVHQGIPLEKFRYYCRRLQECGKANRMAK
ncbi:MAG: hypothetical protein JXL80_11940 [Planctomycetes bacterium]|nr:hypothetical protein [Planctomycetota bacterium]